MDKTLLYEKHNKVAVLTLNRESHHNAFNYQMMCELDEAWKSIKSDPGIVSVVLTGKGVRAFCTGMDLSDLNEDEADKIVGQSKQNAPMFKLTAIHQKCWKPVITAVNGMVCGGGLHFIADSDLVIAAEHATFFDTHVQMGLVAGLEPVSLAKRLPLETVLRLTLLGGSERMDAEEALRCGLVGEVVECGKLMSRAMALAEKISCHSPAAMARSKKAIWDSLNTGLEQALEQTWQAILDHGDHPDYREGVQAFKEKRPPRWREMTEL